MSKEKILFVCQEIYPYSADTPISKISRKLSQGIQEKGYEIRTFMPRFGNVNERRNQLHEVIRLSGMNLVINGNDHSLILKVASISLCRLQIYFIDNIDLFQRKFMFFDKSDKFFKDNDERLMFYTKGVIETVKKLGWAPDVIHCHGWFASLLPIYIKKVYVDNPLFTDTKIVLSVYDEAFDAQFNKNFEAKLKMDGIKETDINSIKSNDYLGLMKLAVDYSDGIIKGSETINPELESYIKNSKKNTLSYQNEQSYINAYASFYDKILADKKVFAE